MEPYRCGYVSVPTDNINYNKSYNEIDVQVHGGLTYAKIDNDMWKLGFDCFHADDTIDKCTLEFCIDECNKLSKQLSYL